MIMDYGTTTMDFETIAMESMELYVPMLYLCFYN